MRLPSSFSGAWVGIRSAAGLGLPGPPVRPSPITLSSSHPALPGLRPLLGPAQSQAPPPHEGPPPGPPHCSPIQMWVRGERVELTSQASKMARSGRL
ncbi:hypothetical protein NN561_014388 [Cricetulus griseus]